MSDEFMSELDARTHAREVMSMVIRGAVAVVLIVTCGAVVGSYGCTGDSHEDYWRGRAIGCESK